MTDRHAFVDDGVVALVNMDDDIVLNRRMRPDANCGFVAAQYGAEPNAGSVGDFDVADQRRGGRYERALADLRRLAVEAQDSGHAASVLFVDIDQTAKGRTNERRIRGRIAVVVTPSRVGALASKTSPLLEFLRAADEHRLLRFFLRFAVRRLRRRR